jgi:hypothetical protein
MAATHRPATARVCDDAERQNEKRAVSPASNIASG